MSSVTDMERAFDLWVELTGLDPNATVFRGREIEIRQMNEGLKDSLKLNDPLGLTTPMLLNCYATAFLDDQKFSVNELLSNSEQVAAYACKARELYSILQSEPIQSEVAAFRSWLIEALEHYHVENEDVFKMVQSDEALAFLRRDALRSIERLQVHQFTQGDPDPDQRPKYVTTVHEFWDINTLIRAMLSNPTLSGVSLNLVRDHLETSSYFAFCIKNGQRLFVLTDKEDEKHPLQKYMRRRPGRDMANRIDRHHFPYGLLDLEYDYRGDARIRSRETAEAAIYQPHLHPLRQIKDLEPDEVIWLTLMFSLIEERFWKQGYQAPELSYTGGMVALGAGNTDALVAAYPRLEVAPVAAGDVTTDKMLDQWRMEPTQQHRWLEERYEHLVPDQVLNLIGDGETVLMLTDGNEITHLSVKEYEEATRFTHHPSVGRKLASLDTTSFGSREKIIADQRWTARYNKAIVIQRAAEAEYAALKDEVLEVYRSLVTANPDRLLAAIDRGEILAPAHRYKTEGFGNEPKPVEQNMLQIGLVDDTPTWGCIRIPTPPRGVPPTCCVNGTSASMVGIFRPKTAEALAILCGCDVSALPDVLQHWTQADLYEGNPILDRIDPMGWVVENPWRNLGLDVAIYLSKRAYNQLRKGLDLPPNRFWNQAEG